MKVEEIQVALLRVGGTNCDVEVKDALEHLGVKADLLHINQLIKGKADLENYHIVGIPGGFSYTDHVRAGVIFARKLEAQVGDQLARFLESEKLMFGLCNGFQVEVELGVLPAFDGFSKFPEAALMTNDSNHYECRLVYLRNDNRGKCIYTRNMQVGFVMPTPIGHSEGKFVLPSEKQNQLLKKLEDRDQIVFRYCQPDGFPANGEHPYNPNGSLSEIAGICDPSGLIFGMMPHPERNAFGWQSYGDRRGIEGPGMQVFRNAVEYVARKF